MAMSEKNFNALLQGIEEGKAYDKGEADLSQYRVHVPEKIDVASIRKNLEMSQSIFAVTFGFSRKSVQEWEQGRRNPERSARILLKLIAREPKFVLQTLQAA